MQKPLVGFMKRFLLVLFLALTGFGLSAQATDAQIKQAATDLGVPYEALKQFIESYKPQDIPSGVISITSVNLYEEYRANELRADTQYKGKTLSVTGPVLNIRKDSSGQYYVELTGNGGIRNIRVYFTASEVSKLGNLSIGQRITIIGTCDGVSMGDVYIRNSIIQN
jgi:hypothetical protein